MANWSEIEDELIIADYFQMLHAEIAGINYNKSEHRKKLQKQLNNRTDSSIEFKHQNISAALINNGLPYIKGYKPRWNYQQLLEDKISIYVNRNKDLEKDFTTFSNVKIEVPLMEIQYENWEVPPPPREPALLKEPKVKYYKPIKKNYLEQEQQNRSVGEAGERLVFAYEKWKLIQAGQSKLAKEIKWVSKDEGDGAGFDILSKDLKGSDIFIEVKTTTLGKETPIFFSKRENDFSNDNKIAFYLYRVFDARHQPKMFLRNGCFQDICHILPINFKGIF